MRDSAQNILNGYHAAVTAANTAFMTGDFFAAATNADNALAVYGSDAAIRKLKADALDKLGDFKIYQLELANAQAALARNDFAEAVIAANSALKKIPRDVAATKIKEAAQQSVNDLNAAVAQAQSAYVLENYGAALALADQALALQKQNPAITQLKSKIARRLDGQLTDLLASFGVAIPPELKYAEMNQVEKLGPIGVNGKPYYLSQVAVLEKNYRLAGWLNENRRQESIEILMATIKGWK